MTDFSSFRILPHLSGANGPVTLELHPTNKCNFNCPWCVESVRRIGGESLSRDVLMQVIARFKEMGGRGIVWEGGGEPTISKDFVDGLRFAHSLGLDSGITTNGSMLVVDAVRRAVCDCAAWCRVSVDAWDVESHSESKGVGAEAASRVIDGMRMLVQDGFEDLGFSVVLSSFNLTHMEEATKLAADIGCKYIQFKPLLVNGMEYWEPDREEFNMNLDAAMTVCGIDVHCSRMWGNANKASFSACRSHELVAHVAATGDVWLCCANAELDGGPFARDKSDLVFGNVNEQQFDEIWAGAARKRIGKLARTREFLDGCPSCRFGEYNELIDRFFSAPGSFL